MLCGADNRGVPQILPGVSSNSQDPGVPAPASQRLAVIPALRIGRGKPQVCSELETWDRHLAEKQLAISCQQIVWLTAES
jgi:hypothetical protein